MNKITKAHLEGVAEFDRTFYYEKGGVQIPKDDISLADVKAFLTTYATNLLNAALEAGPGEKSKPFHETEHCETPYRCGEVDGHNSCRSSFISAINEGIKEIRKGKL